MPGVCDTYCPDSVQAHFTSNQIINANKFGFELIINKCVDPESQWGGSEW